jgi:hypothetical protein
MNLTVTSTGNQYDRLGIMYLGDREIWRTSTAQPKEAPGITWTHWKDLSTYVRLWQKKQKFVFDLGNQVNEKLTGTYKVTAKLTFFKKTRRRDPSAPIADMVYPISMKNKDTGLPSAFMYPQDQPGENITLPRNIKRAVFTVAATAQGEEEFWWQNVAQSFSKAYTATQKPLPGLSNYREIRLLIDDEVAGFVPPVPVVFSGGIVPPLHRPVVGLQAFDLPEFEIDVTAWLGVLCDNAPHRFSLEVWAIDDTNSELKFVKAPMHWAITGKLFVWLDKEGSITSGRAPKVSISKLEYTASQFAPIPGKDGTIIYDDIPLIDLPRVMHPDGIPPASNNSDTPQGYQQVASRSLRLSTYISTTEGEHMVVWGQKLGAETRGIVSKLGLAHKVSTNFTHESWSEETGQRLFYHGSRYSPESDTTYKIPGDLVKGEVSDTSVDAWLRLDMEQTVAGSTIFPTGIEPYLWKYDMYPLGLSMASTIESKAEFHQVNSSFSTGHGKTTQEYKMGPVATEVKPRIGFHGGVDFVSYSREVAAEDDVITYDNEFSTNFQGVFNPLPRLPGEFPKAVGEISASHLAVLEELAEPTPGSDVT